MTTTLDPNIVAKVKKAFDVFDQASNGTCDVREVGTVIRSLGINPSEDQLRTWISDMEDEEPTGYIHYDKFLRVCTQIYNSGATMRNDEEEIFRSFKALDIEGKGYLLPEELKRFMTSEGEPFTAEEIDEMLAACTDPTDNKIYYEDFVTLLASKE